MSTHTNEKEQTLRFVLVWGGQVSYDGGRFRGPLQLRKLFALSKGQPPCRVLSNAPHAYGVGAGGILNVIKNKGENKTLHIKKTPSRPPLKKGERQIAKP
jgi:hypothetical protein